MSARSRWPVRAGRACPSEDALFRWSAGDLSTRQADAIARHVTTCTVCAAQLRAWEATLAACRTHDAAAAPLADDATTVRRFERRLRREPRPERSAARLASDWMPAPRVRWLHAAAALILAAACILWLRPAQATLSAETLIARAVDSDQHSPRASASAVTIAQRAGGAHAARAARTTHAAHPGGGTAALARAFVSDRGPDARELERRLAAYWFDWQAPLSAKPFQHWRASASTQGRSDSLEWVDDTIVRVSTSASAGRVRRAEIMLRAPDYRPVAQVWRFADGFEVELRILDRPAPPSAAADTMAASAAMSTASPAAIAAPRSPEETELDLRTALERAGVVLDRRVSIRRVPDAASSTAAVVSVSATANVTTSTAAIVIDGRTPARAARRIADAARGLAGVDVRLRATAAPEASAAALAPPSPGLQDWLDRTFGASDQRDTFMPRASELHAAFEDAVSALADLAAHYPSSAETRLSPAARRQLRRLIEAYYARVTRSYERLETHLAPLTGTVSRRILPDDAPAEWRVMPAALDPALRQLSAELDTIATGPFDRADAIEAAARDRLRAALAAVAPR